MLASNKAIFQLLRYESPFCPDEALAALREETAGEPWSGYVICPRGCGTKFFWALSPWLIEYKEQFLIYLNQQISWTICPDHVKARPRHVLFVERDWTYLPPAAAVLGGGTTYHNRYE